MSWRPCPAATAACHWRESVASRMGLVVLVVGLSGGVGSGFAGVAEPGGGGPGAGAVGFLGGLPAGVFFHEVVFLAVEADVAGAGFPGGPGLGVFAFAAAGVAVAAGEHAGAVAGFG